MFLLILGVLSIVISLYVLRQYDFFASSPVTCVFKTLGKYKLTTDKSTIKASNSKGLIYIKDIKNWSSISNKKDENDLTYSYTEFTPLDSNNINVKIIINKIMKCNAIPEFSDDVGVNSAAALILCLQSTTTPGSRVFFVKCFVPRSSASDSNVIVGEIENNDIATYHDDIKPVAVIQGALGKPNTEDDYTLSYTICAAKSRPPGFKYSDCCTSILDTVAVKSIPMVDADITTKKGEECTDKSKNDVSDDHSHDTNDARSGLADPNCKKGVYSIVTGGPCSGKKNTDEYLEAVKKSKPCYKNNKWYLGGCDDNKDYEYGKDDEGKDDKGKDDKGKDDKGKDDKGKDDDEDYKGSKGKGKGKDYKGDKDEDEDEDYPNEYSWPQKHKGSKSDSYSKLKPGLSDCQKYYNCKKNYEDDDDDADYEGQC